MDSATHRSHRHKTRSASDESGADTRDTHQVRPLVEEPLELSADVVSVQRLLLSSLISTARIVETSEYYDTPRRKQGFPYCLHCSYSVATRHKS